MRGWVGLGLVLGMLMVAGQAWAIETATPGAEPPQSWKDGATLTIAIIGAVTGVLGAGLGILNTWHTLSQRRLRVELKPAFAYAVDGFGNIADRPRISFEVVNRSAFPVTATEAGFTLVGTTKRGGTSQPIVIDGRQWPRRLEPRESATAYTSPPEGFVVEACYIQLATGDRVWYRGPFIRDLREAMAKGYA